MSRDPNAHPTLNAVSTVMDEEMKKCGFTGQLMICIAPPQPDGKTSIWMRAVCDPVQFGNMVAYALSRNPSDDEVVKAMQVLISHPLLAGRIPGTEAPRNAAAQTAEPESPASASKKEYVN